LRNVHGFCLYCGKEFKHSEQLFNECGQIHSRNNSGPTKVPEGSRWVQNVDQAAQQRLSNPQPAVDIRASAASSSLSPHSAQESDFVSKAVELFKDKQCKSKGPQKYKCGLCAKMFKGPTFVHKHVETKHAEELEKARKDAADEEFLQAYVKDKSHLTEPTERERRSFEESKSKKGGKDSRPSRRGSFDRERPRGRGERPPHDMRGPPMPPPFWGVPILPVGGGPPVMRGEYDWGGRVSYPPRRDRSMRDVDRDRGPRMPTTPGGRTLKNYADLDAPSNEDIVIDYGFGATAAAETKPPTTSSAAPSSKPIEDSED